jgi:hypothetical protein
MHISTHYFQCQTHLLSLRVLSHTPTSLPLPGPPIILSPETGVGLKEGAKTGLATLVCGLCFFVCTFFSPLFAQIPSAGTMPMLFMVRTSCTYYLTSSLCQSLRSFSLSFLPFLPSLFSSPSVCVDSAVQSIFMSVANPDLALPHLSTDPRTLELH